MPNLDDAAVKQLGKLLDQARKHADAEDRSLNDDVDALIAFLVAHSGNELLIKTAEGIVNRAKFVRIGQPSSSSGTSSTGSTRSAQRRRPATARPPER